MGRKTQPKLTIVTKEVDDEQDFQARATKEGRVCQGMAEKKLKGCGFQEIQKNVRIGSAGVTVNFVAKNAHGRKWYFIVSGSLTSDRPGLMRTDTVLKVLGRCAVLTKEDFSPLVLLTTNLPNSGSEGDHLLRITAGDMFFDAMEMLSADARRRLYIYAKSDVVTRPIPGFWTLEDLYGSTLKDPNLFGATMSAPVAKTGFPLGNLDPALNIDTRALGHRLEIIIPSKIKEETIPNEQLQRVVEEVQRKMIEIGGGLTSQRANGHWINPLGGVDEESVTVLVTYLGREPTNDEVNILVCAVLDGLSQEAVAMVYEDTMYLFSHRGSGA